MNLLFNAATNNVHVSLHFLSGESDRRNFESADVRRANSFLLFEKYSDYDYLF